MTIVTATGHRPPGLGGYSKMDRTYPKLVDIAVDYCVLTKVTAGIVGMAQGWDFAFGMALIELGIPFTAAVPFPGQERQWPYPAQKLYRSILEKAKVVEIVTHRDYAPELMQIRNEWMVDRCQRVCAMWDGGKFGGTFKCIEYAERTGKPVDNLWSNFT